jgi:predicted DNA-binding protein
MPNYNRENEKVTTIVVSKDLYQKIKVLAEKEKRSAMSQINWILEKWFENPEGREEK